MIYKHRGMLAEIPAESTGHGAHEEGGEPAVGDTQGK